MTLRTISLLGFCDARTLISALSRFLQASTAFKIRLINTCSMRCVSISNSNFGDVILNSILIFLAFMEGSSLMHQISNKKGVNSNSIKIKKTTLGVPNLFFNNRQVFEALSISHHGEYGAFAIC